MSSEIFVVHNGVKFTYNDYGFKHKDQSFAADLSDYLPEPPQFYKNGKPKKVAKWRLRKKGMPQNWWSAQCAFRGLPSKGKISELKERLQGGYSKVMLPEIIQLQKKLVAEYKIKEMARKAKEEEIEQFRRRNEENMAEERLKDMFFSKSGGKPDVIVMKTGWEGVLEVANRVGLYASYMRAPDVHIFSFDPGWVVVGRSIKAVTDKIKSIQQQANEERIAREKAEEVRAAAAAKAEREAYEKKIADVAKRSSQGGGWDVTGTYKITCPAIAKEWPSDCEEMELKIYRKTKRGVTQMFASFDFGMMTGWFRFVDPAGPPTDKQIQAATAADLKKKGKNQDSEDFQDYYDDYDTFSESEYDSEGEKISKKNRPDVNRPFYFRPQSKPSPKSPTWSYSWRGEETGEGEIQLDEDEKAYSITFNGPGGSMISGSFGSSITGHCNFTGVKIEVMHPDAAKRVSITTEWRNRSEAAYERARVGRWDGRYGY